MTEEQFNIIKLKNRLGNNYNNVGGSQNEKCLIAQANRQDKTKRKFSFSNKPSFLQVDYSCWILRICYLEMKNDSYTIKIIN